MGKEGCGEIPFQLGSLTQWQILEMKKACFTVLFIPSVEGECVESKGHL